MCIALLSTSHPHYPFILLNNRDEFLSRPTLDADWWDPPHQDVLGGRDAQRPERGTWLGITRAGRIAILTNFREEGVEVAREKSRGAIPSAYLTGSTAGSGFARELIEEVGINDVGGFSLLFGELRAPDAGGRVPGLSVLSNRSASAEDLGIIATAAGETHGLSNSHFGDRAWPKVVDGERLLEAAIQRHASSSGAESEAAFVERLFEILSVDRLRQREAGESWEVYVRQMRNSILIPPLKGLAVPEEGKGAAEQIKGREQERVEGAPAGAGYGTQKQTVVLVDRAGHAVFAERTLYDGQGGSISRGEGDRRFKFDIEGWER